MPYLILATFLVYNLLIILEIKKNFASSEFSDTTSTLFELLVVPSSQTEVEGLDPASSSLPKTSQRT
jgi:hypothetical protein